MIVVPRAFLTATLTIPTDEAVSLDSFSEITQQNLRDSDGLHFQPTAGGNIRYWYDKSNPTASEGFLVITGNQVVLRGWPNIINFKVIAVDTEATLQISLGKI